MPWQYVGGLLLASGLYTGSSASGETGALSQALLGMGDGVSATEALAEDPDVWYAADAIEPGCAAGIMVLEHRWSIPLREAILAAGGRNVVTEWVDEAEVAGLGVALPTD